MKINEIAEAMCQTTNLLVKQMNEVSAYTIRSRVGQGKSTNCRFNRINGEFTITYGMKMVQDKLALSTARKWLSTKELERYRFYNGLLSPIHLLAHTIIHESAHIIQNARFARDFGKVHTPIFYAICQELHQSQGAFVLESFREAIQPIDLEKFSQETPAIETKKVVEGLKVGDSVHFVYKDHRIEGVIVRLNEKTATIQEADQRGQWRVSQHLLCK